MIIVNPATGREHISRVFKHMANVWFDYDDQAFQSKKYRWGVNDQFGNHPSMLMPYIDQIQAMHGAQMIVLFINRAIDIPQEVYDRADIVIEHRAGSGTYVILEDRLDEMANKTAFHSATFIAHLLKEYAYGN